jgi:DnaJ-class molecular chaperone
MSFDPKGYYKILNLDKNFSEEDIKKSYKTLAMKWHPDRNVNNKEESEIEFKKISEAYNILKDKETKRLYDLGIDESNPNNFNFSGFNNFQDMFHMNRNSRKNKDIILDIQIDLLSAFKGEIIEKNITKEVVCHKCQGLGSNSPLNLIVCKECNGEGYTIVLEQLIIGMARQVRKKCFNCKGKGKVFNPNDACLNCNGSKYEMKTIKKNIEIEKGLLDNSQLIYENEGHICLEENNYGKLIVNIRIAKHNNFTRIGNHLLFRNSINLVEALCGFKYNIETLSGETITCINNNILNPKSAQIAYGYGMPILGTEEYGHLIIQSDIIFPKQLSNSRKDFIKKVLEEKDLKNINEHKKVNCQILSDSQSLELLEKINLKINNKEKKADVFYDFEEPQIGCTQM